ncbi:uncharacterized protein [Physcomitrium patens]|uniref:uncharacterized protein isoform X1 n=1 Tax=Physcomitrium patens TaxID=3218 RepID=UPI003CCE25A4
MCNVMCMLCLTEQEENCVALRCVHQQQQRASSSVASKLLYSALLYSAQFLPPSLRSHTLATPFPGSRCPSSTSFFFLFIDRHASLSIALFLSRAGRLSSGKRFICFYSEYTSALGHLKQVAHFCFVTVERYCSGNEDSANYTFLNWFELFQVPLPYLIRGGDRVRYGLCGMLW